MSLGGIEGSEERVLEYLEKLIKESIEECLATLRRAASVSGERRTVCKTNELLELLNVKLHPYMVELKLDHANKALESCYRDPGCYFESGGKKICNAECYPKHLAKVIYDLLQERGVKEVEKIKPSILEELQEALGIPSFLRPEIVCKNEEWGCDEEGIRMQLWCKVYNNLEVGMAPRGAELNALQHIMEKCGVEKVIDALSRKPKAYRRFL